MKILVAVVVALLVLAGGYYLISGGRMNGLSGKPNSMVSQNQQTASGSANQEVLSLETELNQLDSPSGEIDFTAVDQDLNNL